MSILKDKKANCMFCSLGCGAIIRVDGDKPVELDYDKENPINQGSLCPRGNYLLELLNNPARLNNPMVKVNRMQLNALAKPTLSSAAEKISNIADKYGADSIGVIIGADRFNEEVFLTHDLFKKALKVNNVDVLFPAEDVAALCGDDADTSFEVNDISIKEIEEQDSLIIIGDLLVRTPCLSKNLNKVKSKGREAKIITVDSERSHTSWFASSHLQVNPGTESYLIAGFIKVLSDDNSKSAGIKKYLGDIDLDDVSAKTGIPQKLIVSAAKEFSSAKKGAILLVSSFRDKILVELSKLLASVSSGKKGVIPFYSSSNAIGSYRINNSLRNSKAFTCNEMIDAAARGKLKALIVIGADPVRAVVSEKLSKALSNLDLLIAADIYRTQIMDYADIIIPLSTQLEGSGTILYSGERLDQIEAVCPPVGAMSVYDLVMGLLNIKEMNKRELSQETLKLLKSYKPEGKFSPAKISDEFKNYKLPRELKNFPFKISIKDDIVHVGDGSVTSNHQWAKQECASPYVEINIEDANEIGLKDKGRLLVKTSKSELVLNAKLTSSIDRGIIAIPHHFQEIRELVDMETAMTRASVERIG